MSPSRCHPAGVAQQVSPSRRRLAGVAQQVSPSRCRLPGVAQHVCSRCGVAGVAQQVWPIYLPGSWMLQVFMRWNDRMYSTHSVVDEKCEAVLGAILGKSCLIKLAGWQSSNNNLKVVGLQRKNKWAPSSPYVDQYHDRNIYVITTS